MKRNDFLLPSAAPGKILTRTYFIYEKVVNKSHLTFECNFSFSFKIKINLYMEKQNVYLIRKEKSFC